MSGIYLNDTTPGGLGQLPARIGLIAGEGNFPLMLAQAARSEGVEIVAIGMHGHAEQEKLRQYSTSYHTLKLTDLSRLITIARENNIQHLIMAGRIPHGIMILNQLSFDMRALKVLSRLPDRKADTLLRAVVEELNSEGIQVLDSTLFLKSCMPEPGLLTPRVPPTEEILRDIDFAYPLAKEIGRLDIGQTIAVKNQIVVAVEALEGTDEMIKRTAELAGDRAVFVKVSKPRQDMRFDVPVVGLTTIRNLASARAAALCVTANQSLFFDRKEAIELAEQSGICIIARPDLESARVHTPVRTT